MPKEFWLDVKDGNIPEGFEGKLTTIPIIDELDPDSKQGYEFKAISKPDLSIFTPREMRILDWLAEVYRDARARQISEVSHLLGQPWHVTFHSYGENQPISYLLSIDERSEVDLEEARDSKNTLRLCGALILSQPSSLMQMSCHNLDKFSAIRISDSNTIPRKKSF